MGKTKQTSRGTPPAKRVCLGPSQDTLLEEVIENKGPQNIRNPSEVVLECIDLDEEPDVLKKATKEKRINKKRVQVEDTSPQALFECEIISVYQKYNRLDKLIFDVVDAVKNSIDANVAKELPSEVSDNWCSNFQTYMVILPSNQVQIIFNGLLNILDVDCISPLEKNPEDMKSLMILPITSQLLRIFLGGVHIADHSVHAHRVVQFMKHMKKLHGLLGRLGSALLQKQYDHSLMRSFLGLCLAWGDLHMLLITYRPIDDIERPKLCEPDTTPTNLFGLHSYLGNDQWSLIAQRITNFGEGSCKQWLDKLILQKLSAMSMFDAVACKESSAAAAKSLAMSLEEDLISTIGNNGLLLTDSLDNRQMLALAGRIVQQLKTAVKWPQNELEMPGFQENRPLILGLLVQTVNEIGGILGSSDRNKANSLPRLATDVVAPFTPAAVEKMDMKLHSTKEIFSAIITDICRCFEKNLAKDVSLLSAVEKTKVDYRTLDCSLSILATLPLENLNEHLQTIILSFCLSLVISLEMACPVDETWDDHSTEHKVQDLILRLLDGRNAPNISKYVKVGPFLRWLSQAKIERKEAHCRKLLELLFAKSLVDIRYLELLEVGVPLLLRDGDKEAETMHTVHFETAVILLQTINKCIKSNVKIQYRCCQMQRRLGTRLMRFSRQLMTSTSKFNREDLLFDAFSASICAYQDSQDAALLDDIAVGLKQVVRRMFRKVKKQNVHSLALLSIVLGNETVLKHLSDDFLLTAWEAALALKNISDQQIKLVEAMNCEQYKKAINALLAEMETEFSRKISTQQVAKYMKLWTSVVTAKHSNLKCCFLLMSLRKLADMLLTASLLGHITNIKPVLGFNLDAVNQREERVSKELIDFYLESITVIPLLDMHSVQLGLKLLTDILKRCPAIAIGRMPAFVQRYTHMMGLVAKAASTDCEDPLLEPCAFEIERLADSIAKHEGFACWGSYNIIADILQQLEMYALRSDVKHHFMNAMRCFFKDCDSHHILYLGTMLTPVSKMMFEAEYGNYIKYHRYVGKL